MIVNTEAAERAELLPKIDSGETEFMDFRARVFGTGPIANPIMFLEADLEAFALSFEGKPFLRDHNQYEIESRDGIILSSKLDGGEIVQDTATQLRQTGDDGGALGGKVVVVMTRRPG